jgi:hypothetical protein
MIMTDWVEVAERRFADGQLDPPAPWYGEWYNEDDEVVTETSRGFAEPEEVVTWALARCERVFVTIRDEVVWAASGTVPLHPILGEPLSTFDAALVLAPVTNATLTSSDSCASAVAIRRCSTRFGTIEVCRSRSSLVSLTSTRSGSRTPSSVNSATVR